MSSYPVIGNRPIDQWKVTELKEELKRRKLTTRGLKDDLIRRLDEALRIERENAEKENAKREKEVDNGVESDPSNKSTVVNSETVVSGGVTGADQSDKNDEKLDDSRVVIDINENLALSDQSIQVGGTAAVGGAGKVEVLTFPETTMESSIEFTAAETNVEVKASSASEVALSEQDKQNPETEDNGMPNDQPEDEALKGQEESDNIKMPPLEDAIIDSAAPNNQVPEVSSNLGFQVKSYSINYDSVSINENNEFKDYITADNIKLELDVVKMEMVEPLSSDVVPVGDKSHLIDVKELHESKVADEEKEDKNSSMNVNMNQNNEIADLGYAEKLNLDRSSGDDLMEEDVLVGKHIDSKHNDHGDGNKNEKNEVASVKEESLVDIVGDVDEKDIKVENSQQSILAEKRKLNDGGNANNEPLKRRKKWEAEDIKVMEPRGSDLMPSATPKDTIQTPARRNFSRSDSTVSDDVPKERVVPPPQKPPTNSLRIDRFLRPFTLKAVQELLAKNGTIQSFWMDHIKTHCYVTYSSVEEANETRNAVYNLQWPLNGGHLLVAEFVEPEEVKAQLEAPPQAQAPAPAPAPATQPPRQQAAPRKQQLAPPPPPLSAQEGDQAVHLPPPPPLPEKADPTIVTLDVLFRKTKATPRIYYLPLSEEQVAAKLSTRAKAPRQ